MKIEDLTEDGRIVRNVNTTCDVDVDEITTQAKKYGFDVSTNGYPEETLYNNSLKDKHKPEQQK